MTQLIILINIKLEMKVDDAGGLHGNRLTFNEFNQHPDPQSRFNWRSRFDRDSLVIDNIRNDCVLLDRMFNIGKSPKINDV